MNEVDIPEDIKKKAIARAPYTISGLFTGSIFGAALFGPPGALLFGVCGGILGYAKDEATIQVDTKNNRGVLEILHLTSKEGRS